MCVQDSSNEGRPTVFGRISPINWFYTILGLCICVGALFFIDSDFTITASGVVTHDRSSPVFAMRGGIVSEVVVDEGDPVAKGQAVLRLETTRDDILFLEQKRRLASSERALAIAEIALEEWDIRPGDALLVAARARIDWMKDMLEARKAMVSLFEEALARDLVSALRLREEKLSLMEAEGALIEARIKGEWVDQGLLELSRKRLTALLREARARHAALEEEGELLARKRERLTLRAPFGGRVGKLDFRYEGMAVEEGEFVFEVIDESSPVEVKALVGERNFDLLRVGGKALMTSRMAGSLVGEEFSGRITEVPPSPEAEGTGGPRYEVEIAVDDTPFPLIEGSTVEVELVLGRRTLLDAILDALSGQNARRRLSRENQTAGGPR